MKILLIGGTGTIGSKVAERLKSENDIITAGSSSGDVQADITDPNSIKTLFKKIGSIDAVIVTAGSAPVKPLPESTNQNFLQGIKSKMMGQINVALTAMDYLNDGGSVTLTSGILAEDPIPQGTILSTINGAINGFVIGANGDFLQQGFRINAVSPALVEDSADELSDFFPGHTPAKMEHVVNGYEKSLKTFLTGEIIKIS
ncbi:NAD(P)-dependent dehydrogenase, short-chain alcohol dehydrogenase family [Fodinibius salinus]|uniref:NAD(P)-dependent dehydrogenase, short-chain alcohol dehydrogenase family n=1 Tax=Fodinibius salinus TaxID=860790 RepID=A0A5D3YIY0_9BACT|nr:short chain dehydrogenase [Fodinibius salinus]TYP93794.1 NAD(P)-dependent dehydrogenase, short-chain alcohol dehydrogenase family [Fodinibius salinus]